MAAALLDALLDGDAALPATTIGWLAEARRTAAAALACDGLPGARSEAWKYTSLRALGARSFTRGDAQAATRAVDPKLPDLAGIEGPRLVFVNGVFRADLSRLPAIEGLTLAPLTDALADADDPLRFFLARAFGSAEPFARLNTALAGDGAVLRVAPGAHIAQPVQLVYVGAPAAQDIAWHARVIIELGEHARLTLIERHLAGGEQAHLGNIVAQFALLPGARLDLVQWQDAASGSVLVRRSECRIEADAVLNLTALELGAQLMRHDLSVELSGRGACVRSRGVFALRGRQHADTHLDVRHVARDTTSDVLWRGVADERARGVFHGAITVAAGADGADAKLSNKNLLLSAQAEIDSQPVLEIHADEVKAAHGATVGRLDERALFYLCSRGLPAGEARRILTAAFCREALAAVTNGALRERLDAALLARLPQLEQG